MYMKYKIDTVFTCTDIWDIILSYFGTTHTCIYVLPEVIQSVTCK